MSRHGTTHLRRDRRTTTALLCCCAALTVGSVVGIAQSTGDDYSVTADTTAMPERSEHVARAGRHERPARTLVGTTTPTVAEPAPASVPVPRAPQTRACRCEPRQTPAPTVQRQTGQLTTTPQTSVVATSAPSRPSQPVPGVPGTPTTTPTATEAPTTTTPEPTPVVETPTPTPEVTETPAPTEPIEVDVQIPTPTQTAPPVPNPEPER